MGRWDPKYTEDQRDAVGRAMCDTDPILNRPLRAKEAVTRLMNGSLGVDPPPQPMPDTTAYWLRDRERARRTGTELSPLAKTAFEDPQDTRRRLIERVVSAHEHELARLEEQIRKGKTDPRYYGMVLKHTPIVVSLLKPTVQQKPGGTKPERDEPAQPESEVDKLIAAHRETAGGTA